VRAYRILVSTLAAVGVAVVMPAAASAEPYPAVPPPAAVSAGTVAAGGSVTFSGTGFIPGETIDISVTYTSTSGTGLRIHGRTGGGTDRIVLAGVPTVVVGHVTASSTGSFSTTVELTQAGTAELVATGESSGVSVSATVHVTAAGSGLATTGQSGRRLMFEVFGGLAAVMLGGVIVWLALGRRRRAPAA
jgi:hypothetical protein